MSFRMGRGAGWVTGAGGASGGFIHIRKNDRISMVLSLALVAAAVA